MTEVNQSVLIIGGGVAGINAALDLADQGIQVYLVERNPSIGGRMAQLDKTFPTLDCSICILAPKMVEVSRHPNIKLLTYAEVEKVEKVDGGRLFNVTVLLKPRYVDESKCTGCGTCVEKCPVKNIPNEFDAGLGSRKAIYIPFPQAVPLVATIDTKNCLYFTKNVCQVCEKFCPAKAVDFNQKEKRITISVASIIVATGFDLLDPSILPQYGYGKFKDVLTSLQYERLLCATGPTGGNLIRPSNGQKPEQIVFIQCVGSRNEEVKPYCSQICCTYVTKQAIITKEHDPSVKILVLYNDIRITGKGQEEFVRRAKEEFGVEYVKGLPGDVTLNPKTGKLDVRYLDVAAGEMKTVPADLVILSPALIPSNDSKKLAEILGIETDEYGFFKPSDPLLPVETNVPGIYVCGACSGPKCITHSVIQAIAAGGLTQKRLNLKNIKKVSEEKKWTVTKGIEKPRIGVFVCHCGTNIASVVDVKEVTEYAKTLPNVVYAEERLFACSKDSQEVIKNAIREHKLNRIVVASCTPRTHEPLFRKTCEEAGLNPYLFEMANIREQCSWVHPKNPKEATEKAKDLVRIAVSKANLLQPLEPFRTSVTPTTLVVGGGFSGLLTSKIIAENGFDVYLVEREPELGGSLRETERIPFKDLDVKSRFKQLVGELLNNPKIKVFTSTTIKEVKGSIGNFEVTISKDGATEVLKVGTIVVATGSEKLNVKKLYGYDLPNVYTLEEYEKAIETGKNPKNGVLAYVLCLGVRETEGRTYCSLTCCSEALDQAIRVKTTYPEKDVYIVYRDMRLPFGVEEKYLEARKKGIMFIRYPAGRPPSITKENGNLNLNVYDLELRVNLKISVTEVVFPSPTIPREDNKEIASTLKVPLTISGFFLESHPKLRPIDFSTDGIYVCGTAYGPQHFEEKACQAAAAAFHALIPMVKGEVVNEPIVAIVDEDLCIGCANCEPVCEYGAVRIEEGVSKINPFICKGCGVCAVECPARAITMQHFTDKQILEMVRAAFTPPPKPEETSILGFMCNWCAYAGADTAGVSRFEYPPEIRIIRVMCSGRVDPLHILEAFRLGADGVLVAGCHPGDCHYIGGNYKAEKRIKQMRSLLKGAGLEEERLRIEWVSAGEGQRFANVVKEFTEQIKKLGPSPIKKFLLRQKVEGGT